VPVLNRLFDELEHLGISRFDVSGGGDPLCHRDIETVLEELLRRGLSIGTMTTNVLRARGRIAELVAAACSDQVTVSLNADNRHTYADMMGVHPSRFDQATGNIRKLVRLRRERGSDLPRIFVQFLLCDATHLRLVDMYTLARDLGVDGVVINPLLHPDELSGELIRNRESFLDLVAEVFRLDDPGLILDLRTIYPELNDRIRELRQSVAATRYTKAERRQRVFSSLRTCCALPWYHSHITPRGTVYPCCALLSPDFTPFGSIHESPYEEIWHGSEYRGFRRSIAAWAAALRNRTCVAREARNLPTPCTVHGQCFLRALPYLDDVEFAIGVDRLCRIESSADVAFPSRMEPGRPARISGFLSPLPRSASRTLGLRVNGYHCTTVTTAGPAFDVSFPPDPLSPGFHLLEIVDSSGARLAARMSEMVGT
jgi:MoaA/NifB/PqqE/SkfB family radical SAM enzyme